MSRHIPVAARREALEIYRLRRELGQFGTDVPGGRRPLAPLDAMYATVQFFAGHYAYRMASGDKAGNAAELLDGWRAAQFYLRQMRGKSWRWEMRPGGAR